MATTIGVAVIDPKGINTLEEVDEQQNIGVAFIEAVIFISIAIILSPLMEMLDALL